MSDNRNNDIQFCDIVRMYNESQREAHHDKNVQDDGNHQNPFQVAPSRRSEPVAQLEPPDSPARTSSEGFASLATAEGGVRFQESADSDLHYKNQVVSQISDNYEVATGTVEEIEEDDAAKGGGPEFKDQVRGVPACMSSSRSNRKTSDKKKPYSDAATAEASPPDDVEEGVTRATARTDDTVRHVEIPGQGTVALVPAKLIEEPREVETVEDNRKMRRWVATVVAIAVVMIAAVGLGVYFGTRKKSPKKKVFETTEELYEAVNSLMSDGVFSQAYGDNINAWDVSRISNFSRVFDATRPGSGTSGFNADVSNWNTTSAVTFHAMFRGASDFNQNLSKWVTRTVQDTSRMFQGTAFNQMLPWDLGSNTNTSWMFANASLFNQDISEWNMTGVLDISHMFEEANSFRGDLSGWDISSCRNMTATFKSASYSYVGNISSWNVSSVLSMAELFASASDYNGDISMWDVSKVKSTYDMFHECHAFNQNIRKWNVSSVTDMSYMFHAAFAFNQNLSDWNVSSVTTMRGTFLNATGFDNDLSNWDLQSVTDLSEMFWQASSFTGQGLSSWKNLGAVETLFYTFAEAPMFNQDLSSWNVSSVSDLGFTFFRASSFDGDISSWNTSSVTTMDDMLDSAISFNQPLEDWDVSAVTTTFGLFFNATKFNQPLSAWNVSSVTDMSYMFENALAFDQPLADWDVSQVWSMHYMFADSNFNQDVSIWNASSLADTSFMFQGARSFNQDLCPWLLILSENTTVNNMFVSSGCPITDDPELPDGPMCRNCTLN